MDSRHNSSNRDMEEILTCPICLDIFQQPHALPCFHTFCNKCIEQLPIVTQQTEKGIVCPMCDRFTKNADKKKNFMANELVELLKENNQSPYLCNLCKTENMAHFCADCNIPMCKKCEKIHKKKYKKHNVTPDKLTCSDHKNQILELYCKTCKKCICNKCHIVQHCTHKVEPTNTTVKTLTQHIKHKIHQISKDSFAQQQQIENLNEEIKKSTRIYNEVQEQFETIKNKHVEALTTFYDNELTELNQKKNEVLNILQNEVHGWERIVLEKQEVISAAETTLTSVKGCRLIDTIYSVLNPKLDQVNQQLTLQIPDIELPVILPQTDQNSTMDHIKKRITYKTSTAKQPKKRYGELFQRISIVFASIVVLLAVLIQVFYMRPTPSQTGINRCINSTFQTVMEHLSSIKPQDEYRYKGMNTNRISHINNQIWFPLKKENHFNIISLNGKHIRSVSFSEFDKFEDACIWTFLQVNHKYTSDILMATNKGLYKLYLKQGDVHIHHQISPENICDIHSDGQVLVGYSFSSKHIVVFKFNLVTYEWQKSHSFPSYWAEHPPDTPTVLVQNNIIYQSSWNHAKIFQYNLNGQVLDIAGEIGIASPGKLISVSLAGIDRHNSILICDFYNSKFQLYTADKQWIIYQGSFHDQRRRFVYDILFIKNVVYELWWDEVDCVAIFKYNINITLS